MATVSRFVRASHRVAFEDVPDACAMFQEKKDGCVKVVTDPAARAPSKERPS